MATKGGPKTRAAAHPRVSRADQQKAPAAGSPDWILALIDARHIGTLIAARKVGLPLSSAAEMAGIPPDFVQTWLTYGRRADQLGARKSSAPYIELCRDFARQWDTALIGTIALLRGYLIGHAKRDPKACVQALTTYEREYAQRKGRRALASSSELDETAEPYQPLDLVQPQPPGKAKLTHTAADGSSTSVEFSDGGFDSEMDGRTDAELEHYADHGYWPHEEPKSPPIDTTAEDVEPDLEVEEEIARLQGAAKREGEPDERTVAANPIRPPDGPQRPFTGPIQVAAPVALPPPPARPLKRLEPAEGLAEAEPVVPTAVEPAKAPKVPAFVPLKRVDPEAMR